MPKGMPASMGATKETDDLADQPSQNREMTKSGPPRHASGRRRYSSRLTQAASRAWAREIMVSQM